MSSLAETLRRMMEIIPLPADDPERIYAEWITNAAPNLRETVESMGLHVEEGPGFPARLKAAVLPKLLEQRNAMPKEAQ